jgi:hypothetical protein
MKNMGVMVLTCLSLAACSTPQQTAGTTAGVVGGAVVGGPVGAVVGGVAGAAVTAPGTPLGAGHCYVHNGAGEIMYRADGSPRTRRC